MKPGQISQPVHSPYGWHVIQVEEIKPAQVATLANSRQKVKDQMLGSQEQMAVPAFMDKLTGQAKVTVNDPQFADAFPSPAASVAPAPAPTPAK